MNGRSILKGLPGVPFLLAMALCGLGFTLVVSAGVRMMESPVIHHGIIPEKASLTGEAFRQFTEETDLDTVREVLMTNSQELEPELAALLAEVIFLESRRYGIDPALVLAVIQTESSFRNWVRSERNALGLMQILPATGEEIARKINIEWEGAESLYLPIVNVKVGIHYLGQLYERFDDIELALAAYNRGPNAVGRLIGRGRTPPPAYAKKVLSAYRAFRPLFSPTTS